MPRSTPVSLLLVSLFALPVMGLSLGREFAVTPPVIDAAPLYRDTPSVASNGADFLVVWHDRSPNSYGPAPLEIRATRVAGNGTLLDPAAIVIGPAGTRGVSVASDGRDYIVGYNCGLPNRNALCFARLDARTGAVAHGARIEGAVNSAIAATERGYLAAYQAANPRNKQINIVEAVPLDRDGRIAGERFRVSGVIASPYPPSIASNGRNAYVLFSTYQALHGVLVSDTGIVEPAHQLTGPAPRSGPAAFGWSVGSDGNDFLVAWHQNNGVVGQEYTGDLRIVPVSRTGAPGQTTVVPIQHTSSPEVTWTGSKYVVAFTHSARPEFPGYVLHQETALRAVTVSTSGVAGAVATIADRAGREGNGAGSWNGSATLFVWEHLHRQDAAQIEARLVHGSDVASDDEPIVVSRSLTWQESVVAAEIGGRVVAAWQENKGERQIPTVFLQSLEKGRPLDGTPVAVRESPRSQLRPALGGSAVVWVEESAAGTSFEGEVFLSFISAEGVLQPPLHLGTAAPRAQPSVAAAGRVHLVVWPSPTYDIVGIRVSPERGVLDPVPLVISSGKEAEYIPVVSSDGRNFFVAWNYYVYPEVCIGLCFSEPALRVAAVSQSGALMRMPYDIDGPWASNQVVVWNGSHYALFWHTRRGGRAQLFDFNANRVGEEREIAISGEPFDVAWNGSEYLVMITKRLDAPAVITRLDRQMNEIGALGLPSMLFYSSTAIAAEADGSATAVYQRAVPGHGVSSRLVARWIAQDPGPTRRRAAGIR